MHQHSFSRRWSKLRRRLSYLSQELVGRFPQGLPKLDPVEDMGIVDDAFETRLGDLRKLELELTRNPHHKEVRVRVNGIFNALCAKKRYPHICIPRVQQPPDSRISQAQASNGEGMSNTQMLSFERKAQMLAQVTQLHPLRRSSRRPRALHACTPVVSRQAQPNRGEKGCEGRYSKP